MTQMPEWLNFRYNVPTAAAGRRPTHDLLVRPTTLKTTLCHRIGGERLTQPGQEYYA